MLENSSAPPYLFQALGMKRDRVYRVSDLMVPGGLVGLNGPLVLLQDSGKLEEVTRELRLLRTLVKEQGERIARLEEQLGRMENGDV